MEKINLISIIFSNNDHVSVETIKTADEIGLIYEKEKKKRIDAGETEGVDFRYLDILDDLEERGIIYTKQVHYDGYINIAVEE
jgi:hypothetical protein